MSNTYFRVSYNNVGIYEAFKVELWNKVDNPDSVWNDFKNSNVFNWLKVPSVKYEKCYSYFTKEGFDLFIKNTYPVFVKYLDEKNIVIDKFIFDDTKVDIVYCDEHQVVIKYRV